MERHRAVARGRPWQPAIWTENWPGWYDVWGQPHHLRRADELAYEVTRFFAAGGSGVNYYMWHGGTNFARDAMYLATTSYDFSAPLDEYGLPTDKSAQLAQLHRFLREQQALLLEGERGVVQVLVPGAHPALHAAEDTAQQLDGGRGDRQAAIPEEQLAETHGVVLCPLRQQGREMVFAVNATAAAQQIDIYGLRETLPARSALAITGTGGGLHGGLSQLVRGEADRARDAARRRCAALGDVRRAVPRAGGGCGAPLFAGDLAG